jgi:hypothetical protein
MKTRPCALAAMVAASSLTLALPAVAAPACESDLPAAHTVGAITYLSGGIGKTEASAIEHVAKYYPLELEFLLKAKPRDEYLADVKVRIKDARHKMVLDVVSEGPFLLASLPAGIYTVSAERNGRLEHREVKIAANEHQRVVFEWRS